jgi:hypothetical protein
MEHQACCLALPAAEPQLEAEDFDRQNARINQWRETDKYLQGTRPCSSSEDPPGPPAKVQTLSLWPSLRLPALITRVDGGGGEEYLIHFFWSFCFYFLEIPVRSLESS